MAENEPPKQIPQSSETQPARDNPFPLKDALLNSAEQKPVLLIEFMYLGEKFKIVSSKCSEIRIGEQKKDNGEIDPATQIYHLIMNISNKGVELGMMSGRVILLGTQFINFNLENYHAKNKALPEFVGLITESIVQVVIQGVFTKWHSALLPTHMKGGLKVYDRLKLDERVVVTLVDKDTEYDGQQRYILIRKKI